MALEVSDGDLGSCASEKPRTPWRGWWWKHRWIGDSEQFRKDRGRLGGKMSIISENRHAFVNRWLLEV